MNKKRRKCNTVYIF